MKKQTSRALCLLLSIVMIFSLFPVSVLAAEPPDTGGISTQADGGLEIEGYTRVTELPSEGLAIGKYLIIAEYGGNYYMLYPGATGAAASAKNSARLELDDNGKAIGYKVGYGTTYDSATVNTDFSAAENTITKTGGTHNIASNQFGGGQAWSDYTVAATGPNGTPYYLFGGQAYQTSSGITLIGSATASGYFRLRNTANNNAQLIFYQPNMNYNQSGNCSANTSTYSVDMMLFKSNTVKPGSNVINMLSGDKIGGGGTADENPDGQNSWVFTGGRAAQGSFADIKGARGYAGHFEEYVRYTNAKQLQPTGEASTPYFQRHVINAAYEGQKLADIVDSFDTRIAPLKPRAVSYLVDENGSSEANFAANLGSLITKALALQNNSGMIVIETLTAADKEAVDAVVNGLETAQQANVLPVQFTLTAAQKTGGYPNANGHLAMAKQLADAVAGITVSSGANWPYGAINASVIAEGFPNKTSLDHAHGYTNPSTLTAGQQAIKTKVEGSESMTWLFMGDSITHGAAWTGGYDSLAQLFEKFVKDDLNRSQDIVINAGSSGATTASTVNDLNRRLVKYSPDVVVLMLGTNDANGKVAENTFKTNLRTILGKIIEKGATAVLRTPPPTSDNIDIATYAQYVRDVADDSAYKGKVILVDQYELWTANDWGGVFSRNPLHPDESGHLWFAHQLIKELALWNDDYSICRLEYKEMKEPKKIEIPGYTQLTDIGQLDETKGYLIVSQDADGKLYAVYPSSDGEALDAGALPSPGDANDGARAAELTVNGESVSAVWLKDNTPVDMEKLLFTIKSKDSGYVFTAFTGYHLNMTTKMFTEGEATLTVTNRGMAALYAVRIKNGRRSLDFTKTGDPNAFYNTSNSSQNINTYGTDFWCPNDNIKMNTYLFASSVDAITAKKGLQNLIEEIAAASLDEAAYTKSSWKALQDALTAADTIVKDTSVNDNDAQVTAKWDALRAAYEGLNTRPVAPTVPEGATTIADWKTMVPGGGNTNNQPYIAGQTGGADSKNFRIPAMITLQHQTGANAGKNGRIVTAIDDRWNHAGDGCSLDTLASYSDDNGATWHYQFANYFGDSTNAKEMLSAAFIDPVLVEGLNGTIYMMVDIWPGGIDLNTAAGRPVAATGYVDINGTKRLALYIATPNSGAQTNTNYDYYVGEFDNGYAPVMEPMGDAPDVFSGYYVDEYYYIYYNSATTFDSIANKGDDADKIWCARRGVSNTYIQQNVFFQNASLHVRAASYLWIITSDDGGENWSKPQMINDQVRLDNDARFYGVGPGAGLCVETSGGDGAIPNGTIILPVYTWSTERAGFIYSTDNGATWQRGNNATTNHSSESCLIQLDNTTVRHFYRDANVTYKIRYTDHVWNNGRWTTKTPVTTDAAKDGSGTQLSAIKYSKQVDGKDVVILSTPGSDARRKDGIIQVFLINNDTDRTMELINTYKVTNSGAYYCYSSLSETNSGDIALLYEHAAAATTFKIISIADLIPDLDVTGWEGNYDGQSHTVVVNADPSGATLQYSTDGGSNWVNDKPSFTTAGVHTVKVRASWTNNIWPDQYASSWTTKTFTREAEATVKINKVKPTLSITSDKGTALKENDNPVFTITGVPSEGTVTLTCSNSSTDDGHNPSITLTKQADGTWTGSHGVLTGQHTFTANYTGGTNYEDATATYSVTVLPSDIDITVKDFSGPYDGNPHSITVTNNDSSVAVTLTYCGTEDGEYSSTVPEYTNAGTYTVYYKAEKEGVDPVTGSANVTIAKATPTITIECDKEHDGDSHEILTTALPLTLTIKGVPDKEQGQLTLTTFNDAVRNLSRNEDGTWTASPNIPPITREYHFIATFDPSKDQDGATIDNPNYERATAEFVVTISRPADEVVDFNFDFAKGVDKEDGAEYTGALTIPYDGEYHSPLEALTYDKGLVLSYHIPTENAEEGDSADTWTDEEPKFRQPGTYTVSVMASPADSSVARVLTVVLTIEEQRDIPTDLKITADFDELAGGGTVTLTVTGKPAAGTLSVTCNQSGVTVTQISEGTYKATLPNADAGYTFTASYSGAGSYQPADAMCTVSVSKIDVSITVTGYNGVYDGRAHTVSVDTEPADVSLVYSTDGGAWSSKQPTFTDAGEYTVEVKGSYTAPGGNSFEKVATGKVTIRQATPTIVITSEQGTSLTTGQDVTLKISGVPSGETVKLTCSHEGHGEIELTKQSDGTYTGTHAVDQGSYTFTAAFAGSKNYNAALAYYSVTVSDIDINVKPYAGAYDGKPKTIAVKPGSGVTVAYRTDATGEYNLTAPPTFTDAGTYTVYYKAAKNGASTEGSANVTITRATPDIVFSCSHDDHMSGDNHVITTTELFDSPLTFTISGVPAEDQGKFTLTTFNSPVQNLVRNDNGTWTASPDLPATSRTYTFVATFDPSRTQNGTAIPKPNYEQATAEFVVTVQRPDDEVIGFTFAFVEGTTMEPGASYTAKYTIPYDEAEHSPLEALTYDSGLKLSYHFPNDTQAGGEIWTDTEPFYTDAGEYTVSCRASNGMAVKVLTVVLVIDETPQTPSLTIEPSVSKLPGGGEVTLTVGGMPAAGGLTVTCDKEVTVTETKRGIYKATLPPVSDDGDVVYTFKASYAGAGSYQQAEAECTVTVTDIAPGPKLARLELSKGILKPAFSANQTEYSANVESDVERVTVTATAADNDATVVIKKDGNVCKDGIVDLDVGDNEVTVTVSKSTVSAAADIDDAETHADDSNDSITEAVDPVDANIEDEGTETEAIEDEGTEAADTEAEVAEAEGTEVADTEAEAAEDEGTEGEAIEDEGTEVAGTEDEDTGDEATDETDANTTTYTITINRAGPETPPDEPVAVTGVTLNQTTASLRVGESVTLNATVAPENATNKDVTWSSSDDAVATVENGVVTAKSAGSATITVSADGGFTDTCAVTVTASSTGSESSDSGGSSSPTTPSTTTTTTTNPDGSTTTTVTDNKTGTVTETTKKDDGTVEVVEKQKDGTVTETTTEPDGSKVEKVITPEKDVVITATDANGEVLAKVELPKEIPAPATQFVDVPKGHWADEAIHNMAGLKIVNGVGDNLFDMNGNMKRGDLALLLSRMSNSGDGHETSFTDVPADKYYANGVAWAAKVGVVTGRSESTFAPEDTITREELAVMLYRQARLLKLDAKADKAALGGFADGKSVHDWAEEGMAWCVENGVVQGKGGGVLDPRTNVTRAEVTVMLQRFMDLLKD